MAVGPDDLLGLLLNTLPDKVQLGCLAIVVLLIMAGTVAYFLVPPVKPA